MSNHRLGTIFFVVCLVLAITIYDVIILKIGGGRATISSVFLNIAYTRPYGMLLPMSITFLLGHLFWPQR